MGYRSGVRNNKAEAKWPSHLIQRGAKNGEVLAQVPSINDISTEGESMPCPGVVKLYGHHTSVMDFTHQSV